MARTLKPSSLKALPSRLPIKVPIKLPSRPRLPDPNEPDVFEEMTLLEHMEELRDRIIKSVIAIGVAFIAGIFLAGPLLKRLQIEANAIGGFDVVAPTDPITLYFKIALYIAIGIALPVLMWQLVGFLVPGLTKKEKRLLYLSMPFVVLLFLLGVAYGFFFAAPRALTFLSGFMSDLFEWSPEGHAVITFFLTLMLGLGGVPVAGRDVHPGQAGGGQSKENAVLAQICHSHSPDPGRGDHAVDGPVQHDDRLRAPLSPVRSGHHCGPPLCTDTGGDGRAHLTRERHLSCETGVRVETRHGGQFRRLRLSRGPHPHRARTAFRDHPRGQPGDRDPDGGPADRAPRGPRPPMTMRRSTDQRLVSR